jgi:hypothetical protein
MYAGEALTIRGAISPKLAYGLLEYRNIFHAWMPSLFQMVDIEYAEILAPDPIGGVPGVATAFSGGVDSFYTLWAHMPENRVIPEARITHGLFIHGLDLRLDDESNFNIVAQRYAGLFHSLELELILASTNAYQFSEFRIDWTMFHGPPLIGAALLMSPFLGRFYVPSFYSYTEIAPQGSSPLSDHLLSTETMDVVHHGASKNRMEKLEVITQWPVTYDKLRVCSDKLRLKGLENCGSCHKCYRTMASLTILDTLENYRNFSTKLSASSYFRWGALTLMNVHQAAEIRRQAIKSGRIGMAILIQAAILLAVFRKFSIKLSKRLITREQLYRLKRVIYRAEIEEPVKHP